MHRTGHDSDMHLGKSSADLLQLQADPRPASGAPRKRPLAKIRHDLRTPVNHIIGYSEMLLEEAPAGVPEAFLIDLRRIRNGGEQLLVLVNQHFNDRAFPSADTDLHRLCHELRTPVNHIIGYSELLMEQCVESNWNDRRADLAKINLAAKTWLGLMEQHLLGADRQGIPAHRLAGYAETEAFTRIQKAFAETAPQPLPTLPPGQGRLLLAD